MLIGHNHLCIFRQIWWKRPRRWLTSDFLIWFVLSPDLATRDNERTVIRIIWHEHKYFPRVIDPFPGHTHSKIKRVYPLDSKSHWLNTFQKYFPSISRADLAKAYEMCFIMLYKCPLCVCKCSVRENTVCLCMCMPASVCLCVRCTFLAGEGKWRGALPAESQCFSRKTNGIVPGADTSFTAKSLPAGLKFQPCKESRSGVGTDKRWHWPVSFRRWRSGGFHYVAVTQH